METDSPVVYHGTSESRFPPEEIKRGQVQLSPEEIRVLRECNKESFYYRCMPLAVAGIAGTFLAVKNGYLKSHPRWGGAGKMTGAAVLGWFIGKFSYRSTCEDKFLKLENSAVGDAVRKRRGLFKETFDSEIPSQFPEADNYLKEDKPISSDFNSSSASLNLDMDKNKHYSGLDDIGRPSTDRENANFGKDEPLSKITSYDDLRNRNREEYDRQHQQSQSRMGLPQNAPVRRLWGQIDSEESKSAGGSKNAYGDSWENPNYKDYK